MQQGVGTQASISFISKWGLDSGFPDKRAQIYNPSKRQWISLERWQLNLQKNLGWLRWKFPSPTNQAGEKRRCVAQATALINNISATFFHKVLTSKSEKCQTLLKYSSHRDFEGSAQTLWWRTALQHTQGCAVKWVAFKWGAAVRTGNHIPFNMLLFIYHQNHTWCLTNKGKNKSPGARVC